MVKFPHTITISRSEQDINDPYGDDIISEIFSGDCCNQVGVTGESSKVVKSDYVAYLEPVDIEFKKGDKVTIIEKEGFSPIIGNIKQREYSELGVTLWITEYGN